MKRVAILRVRWDETDAANTGWYCEAVGEDGELREDSLKLWFPVRVDDYSRDEEAALIDALRKAYPDAQIER